MALNISHGDGPDLTQLREPGPESDRLISALLGLDEKAWTRDFQTAESLVPVEAVYTLSHNDDRTYYWCDVSDGYVNVQGWGRTAACALAAAGTAFIMDRQREQGRDRPAADAGRNALR